MCRRWLVYWLVVIKRARVTRARILEISPLCHISDQQLFRTLQGTQSSSKINVPQALILSISLTESKKVLGKF